MVISRVIFLFVDEELEFFEVDVVGWWFGVCVSRIFLIFLELVIIVKLFIKLFDLGCLGGVG